MHGVSTRKVNILDHLSAGGHYAFTVKANQGGLLRRCKALPWAYIRAVTTLDRGHGRRVRRTIKVAAAPAVLDFAGAVQVAQIQRTRTQRGKKSVEVVYVITSMTSAEAPPTQLAAWVQGHWGIENTCHWSLDVTYREDESRIREKHLRENFAWLYRFTLSLLKQHPGRKSLVMKRRGCGWSHDFLMQVLVGSTG